MLLQVSVKRDLVVILEISFLQKKKFEQKMVSRSNQTSEKKNFKVMIFQTYLFQHWKRDFFVEKKREKRSKINSWWTSTSWSIFLKLKNYRVSYDTCIYDPGFNSIKLKLHHLDKLREDRQPWASPRGLL